MQATYTHYQMIMCYLNAQEYTDTTWTSSTRLLLLFFDYYNYMCNFQFLFVCVLQIECDNTFPNFDKVFTVRWCLYG